MLSISNIQHNNAECHFAECHYAECRILFMIQLKVNMVSVTMLNVIVLSVVAPLKYLNREIIRKGGRTTVCQKAIARMTWLSEHFGRA
jgi:hypothetical protein